ncbi:no individualized sperm [Carabus blaptoides fortunei]
MNDNISLYLSLPNAVDMALGSPEIGAANFNLLNAVLQALIRQIKLEECFVQIRGPDETSVRRLMASAHLSVPVTIPEYDEIEKRGSPNNEPPVLPETDELIRTWKVEIVKPDKVTVPIQQPELIVPLTKELFAKYQTDMVDVKRKLDQILEIPNDSNIVEAMRALEHKENDQKITLNPVAEMWNNLSMRKRVEAAEAGLESMSIELDTFKNDVNETLFSMPNVDSTLSNSVIDNFRMKALNSERKREKGQSIFANLTQRLDTIEESMEKYTRARSISKENAQTTPIDQSEDIIYLSEQLKTHKKLITQLEGLMVDAWSRLQELACSEEMFKEVVTMKTVVGNLTDQLIYLSSTLDTKLEEFSDRINKMHSKYIDDNQNHMVEIERELDAVLKRVNFVLNPDEQLPVGVLCEKVIKLEKEMSAVSQQILEDKKNRKLAMESLTNQIDSLNLLKANQEYVDEALVDKLDTDNLAAYLNRKVSQQKFETAYEQLARNIEDATAKLAEQETRWNATLEEIQATVGSKINKTDEIESLRKFVNKKVKALQRRLKSMSEPKEPEAAATKKILRNVNCISCDQPVVMKKHNEHSLFPNPPLVTGKPTMRPYHAFKLDEIRKQENWQLAKELNSSQSAIRNKISSDKNITNRCSRSVNLSNRYYGGSHTITNAQQRLTRPGHFLDQWGPKAIPLQETYMVGTDNKVYKARGDVENKNKRTEFPTITAKRRPEIATKKSEHNAEEKSAISEIKDEQIIIIKDLTANNLDMASETDYGEIHRIDSDIDSPNSHVLTSTHLESPRPDPIEVVEPVRKSFELKPALKKSVSQRYSGEELMKSDEVNRSMSLSRRKSVKFVKSNSVAGSQD